VQDRAADLLGTDVAPRSLRRSGATGFLWQGLAYFSGKVVVATTTIVLARIIAPEQFGLVALATVFITFLDVVADGGVAQALVYLDRSRETTRSAMLLALVAGSIMAGSVLLCAPAIATFFHESDVVGLTRALSAVLFVGSLSSVPEALLRRALAYRRLAGAAVLRAVITGVTSIGLAVAGLDAWAIVWGTIAGATGYTVACWGMARRVMDLRVWLVSGRDLGVVARYGIPAAAGILLSRLIFDLDYLIVGRRLGPEPLGFYTVAFRLPELAILNIFFVISSVTFPLYSRARSNPSRLRSGYLSSVRLQAIYGVSAGVGLAMVSPIAVPVLLGDNWLPAVECLAALGIYAALRSVGAGANDLYKAIGRPAISVWVSLLRLAILVPVLLWAARYGINEVAWAQAVLAGTFVILMQGVAIRVLGVPVSHFVRAILPALLCGGAVAVTVWPIVHLLPASALLRLVVSVPVGALAVVATLFLAAPSAVRDVRSALSGAR